jgi:dUTP pyrophosphatase
MSNIVPIITLPHAKDLAIPSYATLGSAGLDFAAAIESNETIKPQEIKIIPTGFMIKLHAGTEGQIRSRSGLSSKGIIVLNSPGTIDSDFSGEIKIILMNVGQQDFIISRGMRIAQMVVSKYEKVEFQKVLVLEETKRGSGGFGSTGN